MKARDPRAIIASSILVVLGVWLSFYAWLESDVAQPPPLDERLHIESAERRAWGDIASNISSITVVARGRYALVTTNIDTDNIELLEKQNGKWVRITPNGWEDNVDRSSLMRKGVPFREANALVNGMRRQWHELGGGPDVQGPWRF